MVHEDWCVGIGEGENVLGYGVLALYEVLASCTATISSSFFGLLIHLIYILNLALMCTVYCFDSLPIFQRVGCLRVWMELYHLCRVYI